MAIPKAPYPIWQSIQALDLSSVAKKLAFKKSWWWHLGHRFGRLEQEYRQFLYLIVTNPGKTVVPWSRDLDDFWHEHILDTAKYAADCQAIFGGFIHHNPHLPEGTPAHMTAYRATEEMYRAAFGEKARHRFGSADAGPGCQSGGPVVFCSGNASSAGHHGGDHGGGGGHHGCGGHGGGHGCGGHGCGSGGH